MTRWARWPVLVVTVLLVSSSNPAALLADGLPVAPPVTPPSLTPPKAIGTLDAAHPVLAFNGAVNNPTPLPLVNSPVPLVCAVGCLEYRFTEGAPQVPFLVGIKNTVTGPGGTFNAGDGFDLYVYGPGGQLVQYANGIGANGQAVTVAHPVLGDYTIVVTYLYAEDPNAAFDGDVRLMTGPSWQPPQSTCGITVNGVTGCFQLPRLRPVAAYNLQTMGIPPVASTPLGFPLPVNVPLPTSCYADETIGLENPSLPGLSDPVLRCLRFTSNIQNVGAGPLDAEVPAVATGPDGKLEVGYLPGQCHANQIVYLADGTPVTRPAGDCEFHLAHAHFHYKALLGYALYHVGPGGLPAGKVISSSKASFCLADDDYFGFATPGPNGPRQNVGQPDCNLPRQVAQPVPGQPNTGTFIREGIAPGWGDVYTADTPDQMINVTHVPAGDYVLVEETNPVGSILVDGPSQTCAMTQLRLTVGSLNDTVQQLGTRDSIPCP